MKICWDNLEKLKFTKQGKFLCGINYYIEHDMCLECKEPYIGLKDHRYCSLECTYKSSLQKQKISNSISGENHPNYGKVRRREIVDKIVKSNTGKIRTKEQCISIKQNHANFSGDKHPNWKGGVKKKNIPLYDTYAPQLEPYEQCRRNADDPDILEVKCTYCGKWYMPKLSDINNRVKGINSNDTSKFYCSDDCKRECPIFGKQKFYDGQNGHNSREVQPELRQLVFNRDNYTCQKCSSDGSLHCHHIDPVISNPIESADVDNCITLCKQCHNEVHKLPECRYDKLKKCINY